MTCFENRDVGAQVELEYRLNLNLGVRVLRKLAGERLSRYGVVA